MMGFNCKLSMINWGVPSVPSPFLFPPIKGTELDFGAVRLSLLTIGFDEREMQHRYSLRPLAYSMSAPQLMESDCTIMEMTTGERSPKSLKSMIYDFQVPQEMDMSLSIQSSQPCGGSHFHLLLEDINLLEKRMADSDIKRIEKDILVQLKGLGALNLFQTSLSRTVIDPAFTQMSNLPSMVKQNCEAGDRKFNNSARNIVFSKRKQERKGLQERRLQIDMKMCACAAESSVKHSRQPSVSSCLMGEKEKRMMIAKNEAKMCERIKVIADLEKVRAAAEKQTGKPVSMSEWAKVADLDIKDLQHHLQAGWHCRNEILKSSRPLVLFIARKYRGSEVRHDQLVQAGNIGIVKGAERFDQTRGSKFSNYVQYWIRKEMSRLVYQHFGRGIEIPRNVCIAITRIRRARKILKEKLRRRPDDEEVASFTGLSLKKIKSADRCFRVVGTLDQKVGLEFDLKFSDVIPDTSIDLPEKTVMEMHLKEDIIKLLNTLKPEEKQVLYLRYGFGGRRMTLSEIGKIFNVTKEWIRKLEMRAMTKLKDKEDVRELSYHLKPYS